jgi:penicillin-insensitive murein endopeptidase
MHRALFLAALCGTAAFGDPCDERPTRAEPRSVGRAAHGAVEGAVALHDSASARILPKRHRERCLNWGVPRLVLALVHAGEAVQARFPGSPPLGVGNLGRARGGRIEFSHSHQAGRDVDLAFYAVDATGAPVAAEDLEHFDAQGRSGALRFDVRRTWALVQALVNDDTIDLKWLFISSPLRTLVLEEAERSHAARATIARAEELLHQPSDAPPHDDHLHVRIRCTSAERRGGCRD